MTVAFGGGTGPGQSDDARRGVAYIEEGFQKHDSVGRFYGYWERSEDSTSGSVAEAGLAWDDVEEAIAWARSRAPIVLLRTNTREGSTQYWSAGSTRRSALRGAPLREWPATAAGKEADEGRVPGYGGVVFLAEHMPLYDAVDSYGVRWQTEFDDATPAPRVLEEVSEIGSLEEALAWSRTRARFVILRLDPPPHSFYSAGVEDPPDVDLPRWDDGEVEWESPVGPNDSDRMGHS